MFTYVQLHAPLARASGDVRPSIERKLVLKVETVKALRVRTGVRTGDRSTGAPCADPFAEMTDSRG